MSPFGRLALAAAVLGTAFVASPASAVPFSFTFENVFETSPPRHGGYTSLSLTSGSVSAMLSRSSGTAFDVVKNAGGQDGKPAGWGKHSLDPFFDDTVPGDHWILNLSTTVYSLSIQFGDYFEDSDTPVGLGAWTGPGGTGTQVASATGDWPATSGFPAFGTLAVTSPHGFQSVVFGSGSASAPFPNSLFWDNVSGDTTNPVPEPGTLLLLGSGLAGLALRRRRRNS